MRVRYIDLRPTPLLKNCAAGSITPVILSLLATGLRRSHCRRCCNLWPDEALGDLSHINSFDGAIVQKAGRVRKKTQIGDIYRNQPCQGGSTGLVPVLAIAKKVM